MLSLGVNPAGLMKVTAAFIQWKSENPTKPKGRESTASRPIKEVLSVGNEETEEENKCLGQTAVWGNKINL